MKDWSSWGRAIVSIGACIVVFWWIDWTGFTDRVRAANWHWLLSVFIIIHIDRLLMAYKWKWLLESSATPIPTRTALEAYYIGTFWGHCLPISGAGDIVRIAWLKKKGQGEAPVISSIIVERFLGILALAVVALGSLALFTLYLNLRLPGLSTIVFFVVIASIVGIMMLFNRYAHDILQRLLNRLSFRTVTEGVERISAAILAFSKKPGLLMGFLILSIFEQFLPIVGNLGLAKAFSIQLSLIWAMIGIPIIMVLSTIPVSLNGFGLQEGVYAFVLSFAGIPASASVLMSLAGRAMMLVATVPAALFWTIPKSQYDARSASIGNCGKPVWGEKRN